MSNSTGKCGWVAGSGLVATENCPSTPAFPDLGCNLAVCLSLSDCKSGAFGIEKVPHIVSPEISGLTGKEPGVLHYSTYLL